MIIATPFPVCVGWRTLKNPPPKDVESFRGPGRGYNPRMSRSHRLGRLAEWAALLLLMAKGYRPRHRNWRGAGGELDLVVERRREVVFVEVKARTHGLYGGALGALDASKRKILVRVSSAYLGRFGLWERPCRYDLVTLDREGGVFPWRIRHYRDVFQPDRGRLM